MPALHRAALVALGLAAWIGAACAEEETREVRSSPPLAEAPAPSEPRSPEPALPAEALARVEAPPPGDAAAAGPTSEASTGEAGWDRDDVPWMPGGALVEVTDLTDPNDPQAGMSRTVFEVVATPDVVLQRYAEALQQAGWETEPLGDEMLLATKGRTLVTTAVWPETGRTRVEVFVGARPPGL